MKKQLWVVLVFCLLLSGCCTGEVSCLPAVGQAAEISETETVLSADEDAALVAETESHTEEDAALTAETECHAVEDIEKIEDIEDIEDVKDGKSCSKDAIITSEDYAMIFPADLFSKETAFEAEETPYGFETRKYKYAGLTVAESFGFSIDDCFYDTDGDGSTELLCNVVYGGDGHRELFVYKAAGDAILRGTFSREWLPEGWLNWGSNAAETWFDRDAGDILVRINSLDGGQEDIHFGPETLLFTEYVRYDGNSEGIYVF